MNILLLGSGGREHAFAWKMAQSPRVERLFVAPGNAGTAQVATNLPFAATDKAAIQAAVQQHHIDLVVVGPEQPLVEGVADFLREQGTPVVGPGLVGAQLEGSKAFSKAFMQRHQIPTAGYAAFEADEVEAAIAYLETHSLPIVVKASGLAAGKGVLICESREEAIAITREMLSGAAFGDAGTTVVIEEFLKGIEISIFVLTDGKSYKLLPSAKDYKRIGEGDTGLNTGGMGAVSPVPFADDAFIRLVEDTIVIPTVEGLKQDGIDFNGFIFIGLMVDNGVPYVLEYNARMGDPETEVVLPRIQSDLVTLLEGAANGTLDACSYEVTSQTCVTTMVVSGGYPGDYVKGKAMQLPATETLKAHHAVAFHAGTKQPGSELLSDGGRVMAVSAFGDSLAAAVARSQAMAAQVQFDGAYFRRDIGQDLLKLT